MNFFAAFQQLFVDFLEYMELGGWVMPPLVFLLVLMWYGIGYRFAALQRGTQHGARRLLDRMRKGKQPKKDGVMVRAAGKALDVYEQRKGRDDLRAFLDDALAEEERELHKYNVLVGTIVAVAPLVGLLGTVIGMIETFDSLGDMSLYSQSGGIAGGISQALFTTQMGLAVSIPGLIISGILGRRQNSIEVEIAQIKDILCAEKLSQAAGA